jgi:hypothetical protein
MGRTTLKVYIYIYIEYKNWSRSKIWERFCKIQTGMGGGREEKSRGGEKESLRS